MSALAAVVHLGPTTAAEPSAQPMIETLTHRAPDGIRVWTSRPASLAHAALHATPEAAAERLPLQIGDGSLAITAASRLDNRPELLRELRLPNSTGDGRLILAAYERWGEACPERLIGDFSFAIWNARTRTLFCACDRFAVKPLYWHRSERLAAVATEIKALLALDDLPRRLDETRFADFLTLQLDDPTSTVYVGINRLPPAHSLTLTREGARLQRYWSLHPERAWAGGSDAEYEEAFRGTFAEAVRCRMRAPEPMAAMLSGGMDSSSVVAVAREIRRSGGVDSPLHTISALYDDTPGADEREYIEAVLALGDLEAHFVYPEQLGPLDDWAGAAWRGDEPELFSTVSFARAAYAAVAGAGAHFVLDGLGGDFVVSFGAERLTELAARGRWLALVREARAFGASDFATTGGLLRHFAILPFVPEPVRRWRRTMRERRSDTPDWEGGVPLEPEFAKRSHLADRYAELGRGRARQPRNPRRAQYKLLTSGLVPLALAVLDRTSASFAVEPRYPFFDSRLVELCLAIPVEQKLRNGYNRDILRRALVDVLPPKIRWRTGKARPGAQTMHSLPITGRPVMDAIILGDPGPIARYVDLERARVLYRSCLNGSDSRGWGAVYRVTAGALWLEHARTHLGLEI
jgi:asparagine synthase (glutamine-hydrolysing)